MALSLFIDIIQMSQQIVFPISISGFQYECDLTPMKMCAFFFCLSLMNINENNNHIHNIIQ